MKYFLLPNEDKNTETLYKAAHYAIFVVILNIKKPNEKYGLNIIIEGKEKCNRTSLTFAFSVFLYFWISGWLVLVH